MEEFLPLLSTDLIVFIFEKCIKRMHIEVVCVSCRVVSCVVFRHRNCCVQMKFRQLEFFQCPKIPLICSSQSLGPQSCDLALA